MIIKEIFEIISKFEISNLTLINLLDCIAVSFTLN